MQAALQANVDRQPLLRTSFDLTSYSQPLQLVHRTARLPLGITDLRHLNPDEQRQEINTYTRQERQHRFDPACPPLIRFHIHRRTDETFQLTLTDFHQVVDGWSAATLLTDISTYYSALLDGRPLPAPQQIAAPFRDYVFLEQQTLQSEEARRYWDRMLPTPATQLPRWPSASRRADSMDTRLVAITFGPEVLGALERVAHATGTSLKAVLLAAHLKVLSIATGQALWTPARSRHLGGTHSRRVYGRAGTAAVPALPRSRAPAAPDRATALRNHV
jgi:microcystin synthetase protein McyA